MWRRRPPDELTTREREVLDLIRLGLTNEEIAERLGITVAGAKYHVSQILSKLGVATREEAAAFALEERRWSAAWPLWTKIAGAATVVAAVVGPAVLALGVVRTGGHPQEDLISSKLPKPNGESRLDRDAALLEALRVIGDEIRGVDVEVSLTTLAGARRVTEHTGYSPFDPPDDTATWVVAFRGMFTQCAGAVSCGPVPPLGATPIPPTIACREIIVWFYDASPSIRGTRGAPSPGPCPTPPTSAPLSRDEALVKAAFDPSTRVHLGAPLQASDLEQTTYSQAGDLLAARGWPRLAAAGTLGSEASIWLVTLKAPFIFLPPSPQAPPDPPGPSLPRLVCRETVMIIDAASGASVRSDDRIASGCYRPLASPPPPQGPPDERPVSVSQDEAVKVATQHAGIVPGQAATSATAELLSFGQAGFTCSCYPPHIPLETVWIIRLKGFLSEPLDPEAPATPLPLEPRCGEVIVVISAVTGTPYNALFQHSDSCV